MGLVRRDVARALAAKPAMLAGSLLLALPGTALSADALPALIPPTWRDTGGAALSIVAARTALTLSAPDSGIASRQ